MGSLSRLLTGLAACALAHAAGADVVLHKTSRTEAYTLQGKPVPARDTQQTVWIGADRLRIEDEAATIVVRMDQKKLWILNPRGKSYSQLDLPLDPAKFLPQEALGAYEQIAATTHVVVTPTDETKTFGAWTARKFQIQATLPVDQKVASTVWATRDLPIDLASYQVLNGALTSLQIGGDRLASELRKVDGVNVRVERVRSVGGAEIRQVEEVTSVETKDPSLDTYVVPEGWSEKPFNPFESVLRTAKAAAPAKAPAPAPTPPPK